MKNLKQMSMPTPSSAKIKNCLITGTLLIICVLGSLSNNAHAQEKTKILGKIIHTFQQSENEKPRNKVFVKTDKDIYSPGEKVWFKAEVFNAITENYSTEHELVVMLKGEKGEIIADGKYKVTGGTCDNSITIPSWAKEGNAYLVIFSPRSAQINDASLAAVKPVTINALRRNDYDLSFSLNKAIFKPSEEAKLSLYLTAITPGAKKEKLVVSLYDFNQLVYSFKLTANVNSLNEIKFRIPDKIYNGLYLEISSPGKCCINQRIPIHTISDNITIEFYPEGGTLLANNLQRVIYRAIDPFGEPIDISGTIYDQLGNQTGVGKTIKKGYGIINFMPTPNQKYFFKIDDEYGKNLEFEIPEAQLDGASVSLVKTEDSTLRLSVVASGKFANQELTLAAISNGIIHMTSPIDGSKKSNLKITTDMLPKGIINLVLFTLEGEILSERMVFNTPREDISITIDKNIKATGSHNEIDLNIDLSKFTERFGPSKIDIRIVDKFNLYDYQNVASYSFLKYPLKTPIPKTVLDIYLTNLELIANGYKHYSLSEIISSHPIGTTKPGRNVSGTVVDKNRKGIANATVVAFGYHSGTQLTTTTDSKGHFSFDGITKTKDIVIKAFGPMGKKSYTVLLNRSFDETLEEIILIESLRRKTTFDANELKKYSDANRDLLKLAGTENREPKPEKQSSADKLLQSGTSVLEVIKMTKPYRIENNQIVFYGSTNSLNYQSGALIVIDGQKMGTDISALNSLSPFDVKSINISTNPIDIQKYTGLNSVGVIEINLKTSSADFGVDEKETTYHMSTPFNAESMAQYIWKYQTTLRWENGIKVDSSGKVNLKVKTSDIKSDFVIHVEAISDSGVRHNEISLFSTKDE
jgi:hypothetical protein